LDIVEKVDSLATLWVEFKEDPDFEAFIKYNDVGLPLAYFLQEGLCTELSPLGEQYIVETFDMLLALLEVTEEEIDEVLPDKNLGAILFFAYNKKQNKG
jgi:hypothetical protein